MYRNILFSVLIAVAFKVDGLEDYKKCLEIFNPKTVSCCLNMPSKRVATPEDLNECFAMPGIPPSCEQQLCIAKKKGFANPDNTFNKKVFAEMSEEFLEDVPELLEAMKHNCLDKDIGVYGPDDVCDFIKMDNCFSIQLATHCKNFSDKAECNEFQELGKECAKFYS